MSTFKSFEEITAWQKARELTRLLYRVSGEGLFTKDSGLRGQIRRAGVSIMSNIAEGFERDGTVEFMRFLSMAKGSAGEVRAQLYVALDEGYIDRRTFDKVLSLSAETSRLINGLMAYLRRANLRGNRFKLT